MYYNDQDAGTGRPRGETIDPLVRYAAEIILRRHDADSMEGALRRAIRQAKAVDGAAQRLIGTPLTWVPSGPIADDLDPGNDFVQFLDGEELDLGNYRTTLNCWEAVLVGAMWGGLLNGGTQLIRLYRADSPEVFSSLLTVALVTSASGRTYTPGTPLGMPVRGDIVLFSGLSHVAIATGRITSSGTEILSFWPAPRLNAFGPNTITTMEPTTIEAILQWQAIHMPGDQIVTFGSPDWDVLDQP